MTDMVPSLQRSASDRGSSGWNAGTSGGWITLILVFVAFGLSLLLLGRFELIETLWPVWIGGTALTFAYLAWQTDHWPGVRDADLGLEASKGAAALAVVALAVKGIVSSGLMETTSLFAFELGVIIFVGLFLGGAVYYWFYLFTTRAANQRAETLRILSIAALGIGIWGPVFFANLDIVLITVHFLLAIWAGVIASGQAVAEDSVVRQSSD